MAQSSLSPPETVRGMKTLDKTKFTKDIQVPVLRIGEMSMSFVISLLKPFLLKLEKFKPVQVPRADKKEKLVFLNPDQVKSFDSFSNEVKKVFLESSISSENLEYRKVTLTYDSWKYHDIITAILPEKQKFSGFSIIGNIIHVNLKEEKMDYKLIIGQVLKEKLKNCKSVVCKVKNIENTFRNFEMEVLAGSDDLKTEVKENGCKFELDFSEVFWNPRLHDEHARIIRKLSDGDVLYDVFCGIGPFAIPAARIGCEVLANDLNPKCYEWLQRNMAINKVTKDRLQVFNKSGDVFIKEEVREDLLKRVIDTKYETSKFHIIMNLPDTAHTFLPTFVGLFDDNEMLLFSAGKLPIVHLYCFMKSKDNPEAEAIKLVEETLNIRLPRTAEAFHVRNVAPRKEMIRISFTLLEEVLRAPKKKSKREHDDTNLVEVKELKLDDMEWDGKEEKTADDRISVMKRPKLTLSEDKEMGKSKNHKHNVKNNIFKIAGSKTLKAKNKAKSVTADRLKQLNNKNKQKINDIDERLTNLNAEVRQISEEPQTNSNQIRFDNDRSVAERQKKISKYNETEENCQQALNKLCSMEM